MEKIKLYTYSGECFLNLGKSLLVKKNPEKYEIVGHIYRTGRIERKSHTDNKRKVS